jgi:hypothetical protein
VGDYTADTLAAGLQDTIICVEMAIAAVAHLWAFNYADYRASSIGRGRGLYVIL